MPRESPEISEKQATHVGQDKKRAKEISAKFFAPQTLWISSELTSHIERYGFRERETRARRTLNAIF